MAELAEESKDESPSRLEAKRRSLRIQISPEERKSPVSVEEGPLTPTTQMMLDMVGLGHRLDLSDSEFDVDQKEIQSFLLSNRLDTRFGHHRPHSEPCSPHSPCSIAPEHEVMSPLARIHSIPDPPNLRPPEPEDVAVQFPEGLQLKIFLGTWNLHAKPPPPNLSDFIPPNTADVYVIGTEECQSSIKKSLVFSGKGKWVATLRTLLGDQYEIVAQETLGAIHVIVFVRSSLRCFISSVETGSVATGIADVVGNKGGVAVGFHFGAVPFLFVNCHFHAHHRCVALRNADYFKINSKLQLGVHNMRVHPRRRTRRVKARGVSADFSRRPVVSQRRPVSAGGHHRRSRTRARQWTVNECQDLPMCSDVFEHVFWMGDLNYRVNGTRKMVDALLQQDMLEVLLSNDQLNIERNRNRIFHGFEEAEITFRPTYKYSAGTDEYECVRGRIPSFTDRILFTSSPHVEVVKYDAVDSVKTSDHRPVFARVNCFLPVQTLASGTAPPVTQDGSRACGIQ